MIRLSLILSSIWVLSSATQSWQCTAGVQSTHHTAILAAIYIQFQTKRCGSGAFGGSCANRRISNMSGRYEGTLLLDLAVFCVTEVGTPSGQTPTTISVEIGVYFTSVVIFLEQTGAMSSGRAISSAIGTGRRKNASNDPSCTRRGHPVRQLSPFDFTRVRSSRRLTTYNHTSYIASRIVVFFGAWD